MATWILLLLSLIHIQDIRVEGLTWSSPALVRSMIPLAPGSDYTPTDIRQAVKKLLASGRFSMVDVEQQGPDSAAILVFHVEETPRLGKVRVVFHDRKHPYSERKLLDTLGLNRGIHFVSPSRQYRWEQEILSLFRDKGYLQARVTSELQVDSTSGIADLTFQVWTGPRAIIRQIEIVGNQAYPDNVLEKHLKNKEKNWHRKGTFNAREWEEDLKRLEAFYHNHGYPEARVDSTRKTFDSTGMYIKIFVTEGKRYRFGPVSFQGDLPFPGKMLHRMLPFREGELFSQEKLEKALQDIQGLLADSGYLYATVFPLQDVLQDSLLTLRFQITRHHRVRVRRMDIVGNHKTLDRVIRREFVLFPGDYFSRQALIVSTRNVYFLNYFENVVPSFRPTEDSGWVDLVFDIKEKTTGTIGAGASYSGYTGGSLYLQLQESNFLGRGQSVSALINYGDRQRSFQFSFLEPWLGGKPQSMGGDLHALRTFYYGEYTEERAGGSFSLGWRTLRSFWRVGLRYSLDRIYFYDISDFYKDLPYVQEFSEKPRWKSTFQSTFTWDSRNRRFNAFRGTKLEYTLALTGAAFGGDLHYHKHLLEAGRYFSLPAPRSLRNTRLISVLGMRGGLLDGYTRAEDVPFYERFLLGDVGTFYALRGYPLRSIGRGFGGGRFFVVLTAQLRIRPSEQFYGMLFAEAGNTWADRFQLEDDFRQDPLHALYRSVGIGFRMEVPMLGVMGIDFAYGMDNPDPRARFQTHFVLGSFEL